MWYHVYIWLCSKTWKGVDSEIGPCSIAYRLALSHRPPGPAESKNLWSNFLLGRPSATKAVAHKLHSPPTPCLWKRDCPKFGTPRSCRASNRYATSITQVVAPTSNLLTYRLLSSSPQSRKHCEARNPNSHQLHTLQHSCRY